MSKVLIYRRFSTDEQESGDSLARQSRICEAFASKMGWTVSETLTDRGLSAYKGEHLHPDAALGGLMAKLDQGDLPAGTVIIAERLDRLSRRPVGEAMSWLHTITARGVRVAIADKDRVFDGKMSFEDFLTTALSFATGNEESTKKSERIISAKHRMWALAERREGKWANLSNRPPSWLSHNKERNGWIVDEERAGIVRDIYQWSADGLGAVTIASRLNASGLKPWGRWGKYADKTWGRTAIRQILENPAVEGDFVPRDGVFLGKTLHDFFPRVVEADIVASARAGGQSRKRVKGKRVSSGTSNLFSGRTECGECGKRAFLSSHTKMGREYIYVRCEGAHEGRSCTNTGYYPYAKFESSAMDLLLDLALDDRFFESSGELREARIAEAELSKSIADKRAKRTRLLAAFSEDEDQDVLDMVRAMKVEIDDLTVRLTEAQAAAQRASGRVNAVEHLRRVSDIREAAQSSDDATRQQARARLRTAFSAIINSVSIERDSDGNKVFTVALRGAIMGVRIDTKGRVVKAISDAMGKPLWSYLTQEKREQLAPLIRRIEALMAAGE